MLFCLLWLTSNAVHAQPIIPAQSSAGQIAAKQQVHYIGIMGQVTRPAVYAFRSPFPPLTEVVQQAGGLAADASANIRIIRNGQAGQQTFYTPQSTLTLMPGDLLVVDRDRRQGRRTDNVLKNAAVQIGMVGLLDRPVVLKIPRQLATLSGIVSQLGQHPNLSRTINVISPPGVRTVTQSQRLVSPSVLIFNRTTVQQDRLPVLDKPIVAGQPTGNAPLQPSRQPGRILLSPGVDGPGLSPIGTAGVVEPLAAPPEDGVPADADSVGLRAVWSAHALPQQTPAAEADVLDGEILAESPLVRNDRDASSPRLPTDSVSPPPVDNPVPQPVVIDEPDSQELAGESSDWGLGRMIMTFLGACGVLAAVAILWSMARTAKLGEPKPDPQPASQPKPTIKLAEPGPLNSLDALIENSLPLIEEPLRIPASLEFHGRPSPVRRTQERLTVQIASPAAEKTVTEAPSARTWKLHDGRRGVAALAGPHFRIDRAAIPGSRNDAPVDDSASAFVAAPPSPLPTVDTQIVVDQSRSTVPTRVSNNGKQGGLLDRVLISVHGASAK